MPVYKRENLNHKACTIGKGVHIRYAIYAIHDTQGNTYEAKDQRKKAIVDSILSHLYLEKYLEK